MLGRLKEAADVSERAGAQPHVDGRPSAQQFGDPVGDPLAPRERQEPAGGNSSIPTSGSVRRPATLSSRSSSEPDLSSCDSSSSCSSEARFGVRVPDSSLTCCIRRTTSSTYARPSSASADSTLSPSSAWNCRIWSLNCGICSASGARLLFKPSQRSILAARVVWPRRLPFAGCAGRVVSVLI